MNLAEQLEMKLPEQIELQNIIPNINTANAIEQINLLHNDADKYITVATINPRYKQWHYTINELLSNLNKLTSMQTNTYISPTEFYIPKRSAEAIRRLNALFIDFDLTDKNYEISGYELDVAIEILRDDYFNKVVPEPTMLLKTGRGLHLYWKIDSLPKNGLPLWTMVQANIMKKLEKFTKDFRLLKVDDGVKDCTRVLRLADTINTKNGAMCELALVNDENVYRLNELIPQYFEDLIIIKDKKDNKGRVSSSSQRKVLGLYNFYHLHQARLDDIVMLQTLRSYGTLDYRRRMCFLYRYYSCLFEHDKELALENTLDFNSKFQDPLTNNEVLHATKSAEKAYDEWCKNTEEDFLKPVYNKETGLYNIKGYNYTNARLIKMLDITDKEQTEMKTIISKGEKYNRNNKRRREERRNDEGLTKREQEKQDLINKVKELKSQGFKQKDIVEKLGVSKGTVSKYLKL